MKFRGNSRLLPFALACMPMFAVPGFAHAQGTAPSSALLAQNTDANTELYFSVQQLKQEVLELRGMVRGIAAPSVYHAEAGAGEIHRY